MRPQWVRKRIKGCLEVRTIKDSRMGSTLRTVPKGQVGYIMGQRTDTYLIFWPDIPKQDKFDWRTGSHLKTDVEQTGSRG